MTQTSLLEAVQNGFWETAEHLMFHHTNPWELDEALVAWGYDVGPCEAQDLLGLDAVLARNPARAVPILPRMVAEGRMGKIGGVGYYRYPGGGGAVIDPLIEDLILEEAWFARVRRHEMQDSALVAAMNSSIHKVLDGYPLTEEVPKVLAQAVHFPPDRIGELTGP